MRAVISVKLSTLRGNSQVVKSAHDIPVGDNFVHWVNSHWDFGVVIAVSHAGCGIEGLWADCRAHLAQLGARCTACISSKESMFAVLIRVGRTGTCNLSMVATARQSIAGNGSNRELSVGAIRVVGNIGSARNPVIVTRAFGHVESVKPARAGRGYLVAEIGHKTVLSSCIQRSDSVLADSSRNGIGSSDTARR
jgi:hypothetical protein